jgi:glucosaminylphosphatidylinositol acyltransferase
MLIAAYFISNIVFGRPSRRLCNLPYIMYQTALINSFVCYLLILDRLLVVKNENMIECAINYNQLQFFVWANLLTGLTNLSIKTYYQSSWVGYVVMFMYLFINLIVVGNCRRMGLCKNLF